MLIIFIVPLWSHSRTMIALVSSQAVRDTSANVQAKKIIDQVIRRNFLFSSIALVSACCALLGEATLMWLANESSDPLTQDTLRIWATTSVGFDNIISLFAIHSMTLGWLPRRCRRKHIDTAVSDENTLNQENAIVISPTIKDKSTIKH